MSIIYSRLFEVSILHNYFQEGIAKAIKLIPTLETQETFKKGRMLFRETPQGIIVLYRANEDAVSPMVELTSQIDFFYLIQVQNASQFFSVTELKKGSRKYRAGDFLVFQNSPASASNDSKNPEKIAIDFLDGARSKTFSTRVKLNPVPTKAIFQIKDSSGTKISSGRDIQGLPLPVDLEISPDDNGEFLLPVDLKGKADGNYILTLRNESDTSELWKKQYFLTQDSAVNSALGVLKISYRPSPKHLYGSKEFYSINLKRKATKWKYIIVSQNKKIDLSVAQLSILDKGNPAGSPYATYLFIQEGAAPNADVKINNADAVIFKSQQPIPFFESPKLNLELRRKPGNRVLIGNLPNPARSGNIKTNGGEEISEIYVFI